MIEKQGHSKHDFKLHAVKIMKENFYGLQVVRQNVHVVFLMQLDLF